MPTTTPEMRRFLVPVALVIVAVMIVAAWYATGRSPSLPVVSPATAPVDIETMAPPSLAIRGATVIDATGSPSRPDTTVVIAGSRIREVGAADSVAIPDGIEVIDAEGKFIIPGLADMHNHLRSGVSAEWENPRPNLGRLLGWGITMTFAPAQEKEAFVWLKTRVSAADAAPYARFWGTGPLFVVHGNDVDYGPSFPEEARAAVRELGGIEVDAVKIVYDDSSWVSDRVQPLIATEVLGAIIDEAHRQGLEVYVHAPVLEQAKTALHAGADGLLHGIISAPVDDEFISLMQKNDAVYVSTLSLFESCADLGAWAARQAAFDEDGIVAPEQYASLQSPETLERIRRHWSKSAAVKAQLPTLHANLRRVFAAGIPVVTGTDTGIMGVVLGPSSHLELVLHVEAGMTPEQVLQAATINAARMVGRESDLGTIEAGKRADLLILDADPLTDIGNTRRISRVVKGGKVYEPKEIFRLAELQHAEVEAELGW